MTARNAIMENIYSFRDEVTKPDSYFDYDNSDHKQLPIVIDNGSFQCRAGWAGYSNPEMIFKNAIAKQRGRKDCEITVGNDISNIEVVRWQLKTQFERNVVTHFDSQETILDYIFSHLGINTSGQVEHPIVMTEPLCNPNYCRQQMSELLFEAYHVPSVTYGLDSLFSLYNNQPNLGDGSSLVLSCGYHTISILPILNGRLDASCCRRINMGGFHLDGFMQRLLQLKYPAHANNLTLSRAEELNKIHCMTSVDYQSELSCWAKEEYYMKNVHIMELPHNTSAKLPPVNILTPEQQKEKRDIQIRRLKEMSRKRREEKLIADQERLQLLFGVLQLADEDESEFERSLEMHDFSDMQELQMAINHLNNAINKLNNSLQVDCDLDIPRAKKPKEDKKHQTLIQQIESMRNQRDMDTFLEDIQTQKQSILDARSKKKQHRADMAKRRTLAGQQRMRIISELAQGKKTKKEDTFGANDDDWNVYKQINKDGGDSDSDAEQERMDELDTILKLYDPNFKDVDDDLSLTIDPKEFYRLYVGVERVRIPELLFQPSMMGFEQAGLIETLDFVLKKYDEPTQDKLVQNIFVTGGCSSFPNLSCRLERELLALRPFQSKFKVTVASNPALDSWHGAQRFALDPVSKSAAITRSMYDEMGCDYLQEHCAANIYFPSPIKRNESFPLLSSSQPPSDPIQAVD